MASTKNVEDTLPLEAPEAAHPIVGPTTRVHYSVYDILDLDASQEQQLLSSLNSNDLGSQTCRLAPGQHQHSSLRHAYDHHIHARDEDDTIHPYVFFVADDRDSRSVLLVNLKAPTERKDTRFVIGVCRCSVGEADLMAVNFDVGNVDWIERKESEESRGEGPGVYCNERYFPSDPRIAKPATKERKDGRRYAWFSLVKRALPLSTKLEADYSTKDPSNSRFTLAGNVHTYQQPFEEIRRIFPYACWMDTRIDRDYFLMASSEEGAMSLYRAKWDAEWELAKYRFQPGVEVRDQPHLRAVKTIMPEIEFVEEVAAEEALGRLQSIPDGAREL